MQSLPNTLLKVVQMSAARTTAVAAANALAVNVACQFLPSE